MQTREVFTLLMLVVGHTVNNPRRPNPRTPQTQPDTLAFLASLTSSRFVLIL
ncbi:hypothetical protein Fuma_01929 [Fuerstiella marisgermanici]|uniref:Uncharacterized protein n=1 Tax=Fuerstiella marisgermanici TaxID=1891926 RepID=A0A1P8WE68_9PLAN|nr:hypothetical protein Fuma_01929 [Fuerstiella marisgermanici]